MKALSPVRMALPLGPRPLSVSAHVMLALARYPSSTPTHATGRTVFASSCPAYPAHAMRYPGIFANDTAYVIKQRLFVLCPHQCLVAVADGLQFTIQPALLLFSLLALDNFPGQDLICTVNSAVRSLTLDSIVTLARRNSSFACRSRRDRCNETSDKSSNARVAVPNILE